MTWWDDEIWAHLAVSVGASGKKKLLKLIHCLAVHSVSLSLHAFSFVFETCPSQMPQDSNAKKKQWSSSSSSRPWQGRNQQNKPCQNHTRIQGLGGTPMRKNSVLPRNVQDIQWKWVLSLSRVCHVIQRHWIGHNGVSYLNACVFVFFKILSILWFDFPPDGDLTDEGLGFNIINRIPLCVAVLEYTMCHHIHNLPYHKPIPFCECTLTHFSFNVWTVNSDKSKHLHYTLKGDKGFPKGGIFTFISPCRLRGLLLPSHSVDCFYIWYPLVWYMVFCMQRCNPYTFKTTFKDNHFIYFSHRTIGILVTFHQTVKKESTIHNFSDNKFFLKKEWLSCPLRTTLKHSL